MSGTVRVEEYIYTENVYYDEYGRELGRERNYDDSWYDTREIREMTEQEEEDWG